ncbi:MAG: ATP-dependent DNA ligase [Planctomycetota bacterium]
MTMLATLAQIWDAVAHTSARSAKVQALAQLLRELGADEVAPAIHLLLGCPLGPRRLGDLTLGGHAIGRALTDLGTTTGPPLAVLEVTAQFERIAAIAGPGSKLERIRLVRALFARASERERQFLLGAIFAELRQGVKEGVMLLAVAAASRVAVSDLRRALQVRPDLGAIAVQALLRGATSLEPRIDLFTPVQPMLAMLASDLAEALAQHGGETAMEYKLDGARVQIHKRGSEVHIYSRHLNEITASLPEVVEMARGLAAHELIVEGEAIAIGSNQRPLPFQDLMRRFRRLREVDRWRRELPLRLQLFDALLIDGQSLLDRPARERGRALSDLALPELIMPRVVLTSTIPAAAYLERSLALGHEGLMAKALDSRYEPGARGGRWLKIKPAETLDLVITAAEWGHGRRQGWLSNYHLAARDAASDGAFKPLGKTFKGLTDADLEAMTQVLLAAQLSCAGHVVHVRPAVVVEVAFNEIQKSPRYASGFALRFARVKRFRHDKTPAQVDTIDQVAALYHRQFDRKDRG